MTEKLSDKMKRSNFQMLLPEVELLEAERDTLKEQLESFTMRFGSYGTYNHTDILKEIERLNELTHTLDKAVKLSDERAESAEAKVKELTDLNSGLSEQAQGLDYCAEEAEKKLKNANDEIKRLTTLNKSLRLIVK